MRTITGIIADTKDQPRPGVRVEFIPLDTLFPLAGKLITSTTKTALTDDNGEFETDLLPGAYTFKVYKPNNVDYDEETITVPSGSGELEVSTLITSTTSTGGTFNHCVGYERGDSVANAEYVGGRNRWVGSVFLKSATVVCSRAPVGAPAVFTLEVDGDNAGYSLTVAAGETEAEVDLENLQVTGGTYIRWKCTGAPSDPENFPAGVCISMNLNS